MALIGSAPPRTSFIGRDLELAQVTSLLSEAGAPLVTITGPGGVGKTRVAMESGPAVAATLRDGGLFVPLAPISDWHRVPAAIAHAAGLRDKPALSAAGQLPEFLQPREMLLVLDNLEQVTGIAPDLSRLLRTCPGLQLLVTSRQPLHLQEEQEFPLSPLPLPETDPDAAAGGESTVALLAENAAVRLFVQRSQAVRPDFALTPANAAVISHICHRLDGLPLAIELGAARSRLLPPAALLARLDSRLPLLTGGGPDRPGRHQSMRDAIAWSYDMLQPHEQAFFRRLSIFAGGVTLAAAAAVAAPCSGDSPASPAAALDILTSLVDATLLRPAREHHDEPRFMMLETIREFGQEQLDLSGETAETAKRHAHHVLATAETAAASQRGSGQVAHLAALETEQENVRTALEWATTAPERADVALRLADAMFWYWYLRGHFSEGRVWLEKALRIHHGEPSVLRARVLGDVSVLAYRQGDYAAGRTWQRQSAEMCRALGDLTGFVHALHYVAVGQLLPGDEAALQELIPQGVAQFRASGQRWELATALSALGMQALVTQDYDSAAAAFAGSEAICRESGDTWGLARTLHYRGELARYHGDLLQARRHYEESLYLLRALEHRFSAATVLHNLGYVAMHQDDLPAAMTSFAGALEQHLRYGNQNNVAHCLGGIAGIAGRLGRTEPAARLFGAAARLLEATGAEIWPIDRADYERNLAAVRRQLGEMVFTQLFTTGYQRPVDESLAEARHEAARAPAAATSTNPALSPRQQEILRLLCAGDSDREIGAALHIGRRTVETHIAAIYTKLGAHNRAEAAATAVRLGLI